MDIKVCGPQVILTDATKWCTLILSRTVWGSWRDIGMPIGLEVCTDTFLEAASVNIRISLAHLSAHQQLSLSLCAVFKWASGENTARLYRVLSVEVWGGVFLLTMETWETDVFIALFIVASTMLQAHHSNTLISLWFYCCLGTTLLI